MKQDNPILNNPYEEPRWHYATIRAFGSQHLCEQVAGRALRRRSYFLKAYDKDGNSTSDKRRIATRKFPPEHAHIIGVPFKMFKGGKTKTTPPADTTRVAKVLEDLTDEGLIQAWIKNNFLDFRIPYVDQAGKERDYYPDFILRASLPGSPPVQLIVEVTGMKKDIPEKVWAVENRWLPAVNAIRQQRGWPRWDFLELDEEPEAADARNRNLKKL